MAVVDNSSLHVFHFGLLAFTSAFIFLSFKFQLFSILMSNFLELTAGLTLFLCADFDVIVNKVSRKL